MVSSYLALKPFHLLLYSSQDGHWPIFSILSLSFSSLRHLAGGEEAARFDDNKKAWDCSSIFPLRLKPSKHKNHAF
jgi:hypothetical protein